MRVMDINGRKFSPDNEVYRPPVKDEEVNMEQYAFGGNVGWEMFQNKSVLVYPAHGMKKDYQDPLMASLPLDGNSSVAQRNITMNYTYESPMTNDAVSGLTVLYSLTTILSITGNIFVVLVFARGRRSRTDLRPFLINLAAADLIMALFCMPFTFADVILGEWIFYKPLCPIVLFLQLMSVAGSVFTNMAIGIDRFLAVTFPLRSRVTTRSKYVIIVIWICAAALGSVYFFKGRAVGDGSLVCTETWEAHERKIFTISILIITYIVPLIILTITYSIVGILLWKRTAPGNKDHVRDMHRMRSKIKVMKMLVIVVAIFGICWLPIHAFNLVHDFFPHVLKTNSMVVNGIFLAAHWLAMSNSFANPIIYGFTNESFRADLVTLFYMWMPCCRCLKSALPARYGTSTNDSVILRHASFARSTKWNTSTFRSNLSLASGKRFLNGSGNQSFSDNKIGADSGALSNKRYLSPVIDSRDPSNCSNDNLSTRS